METQQNIISSNAKLSAIAGIMFFAPFLKNSIKSDPRFSEEEKNFIMWYIQVWFLNFIFLVFVVISSIILQVYYNVLLDRISYIWTFAIYIITLFSLFACVSNLGMRESNESIMQDIQHKDQLLKVYAPLLNFSLRFSQKEYSRPYWRLKESILLWTCFIFGTIIFGSSLGFWILVIIAIRLILLLMNIDIIPISMKKAINWRFSCNPWEIIWYISAYLISKIKKLEYETALQSEKLKYAQGQSFWAWVVIQYILFIWLIYVLYLYNWTGFSITDIILWIAILLRIVRMFLFYKNKGTFLRIPIISEIVSIVFH